MMGMKPTSKMRMRLGLVRAVKGTAANEADITQTAALLHREGSVCSAMPGWPTSGLNLRIAMYDGTSRSSAAS